MKRIPMLFGNPGHRADADKRRWSRMGTKDRELSMAILRYESAKRPPAPIDFAVVRSVTVGEAVA